MVRGGFGVGVGFRPRLVYVGPLALNRADALGGASQELFFSLSPYFYCSELEGVTMPGFGKFYVVSFVWVAGILEALGA